MSGSRRRLAFSVALIGIGLVVVALGVLLFVLGDDEGDDEERVAASTTVTTVPEEPTEPEPVVDPDATAGPLLREAACAGELEAEASAGFDDPNLVEVSGIAIAPDGTAWVHNDSGDAPRIYGLRPDGSVQTVEVTGADHIDWEDIALQMTQQGPMLWIADTGTNLEPRVTVQLYRVPVPAADATTVEATRFDVTYRDGSHDVEAMFAEPDGSLVFLTKAPGTARIYRVAPEPSGEMNADYAGEFTVGDGVNTVVTGADLTADGTTVVLRTYGSVFVVVVDQGESLTAALQDTGRRCRGIPPMELQGESVAFLPDGSGYVTIGEGESPYLTTVHLP